MSEPKIKLVWRKIDELIPYEHNAKLHPQEQIDKLVDSFDEFGRIVPAGIDRDGNLIYGHGRILAARQRGDTDFPCIEIDGLSETQRRAFVHADNLLAESGTDEEILRAEMQALQAAGFNVAITGFDPAGLTLGDEDAEPPEIREDDFDEDPPKEPRTKRGQIWQLGSHRLMCGDSTVEADVLALMDGAKAKMVFTDPPWNVNYGAEEEGNPMGYKPRTILNDFMGTEDFKQFMDGAFHLLNLASEPGCMTYVVMSAQEWGNCMLTLAGNDYHWSSTIIWNKDRLVLSRKDYHTKYEPIWYGWKGGAARLHPLDDRTQSDVWDFDRPKVSVEHPTMKPIALVAHAIQNSSSKGDVVLDLFGGSGTTMMACEQTGRHCRMMELDPKYVDVIIDRWETFTGEKAVLLNG